MNEEERTKTDEERWKELEEEEDELRKKYSLIGIVLAVFVPIALILIALAAVAWIDTLRWIAVLPAIIWLCLSIKIVGPAEMAVKVILGVPVSFANSGVRLIPFFSGCYLVLYPKKLYNLDYQARTVISKAGEYPPGSGKKYGAQVLTVDSVAYIRFPRDNKLIEILKSRVPAKKEEMLDWTEESVVGSLRIALGKITWKQATEEINDVRVQANEFFRAPDGALLIAGFKRDDLKLAIEEIVLPSELVEALPLVDKQRLEAEAAPYEADQRAEETAGAVIETFCKLTGMKRETVEEELRKAPGKFIRKYNKIWERAWDIISQRMAIDGKSYLKIDSQNPLQDLIALFKRMPSGIEKKIEQ